ncbi:divalent cation tolerance protein CutA [Paracoccus methylarcula]|uniref:divalent cation tolerance protein CutA n=1 Tax=Paracoccus methylarcula TaxID=72022 RepID=UPI000F45C5DB|nr:divalent cation tolerance protein CutA [Paracoccus methylarcula]
MMQITTTCPDLDSARLSAHEALRRHFAACANILPVVTWKTIGTTEAATDWLLSETV